MLRKVLTFRASSIGDSLMGKYFLEQVRARYPKGRYAIAVSSRVSMVQDLFAGYPWLEVVEVSKKPSALLRFVQRGRQDVIVTPYTGGTFGMLPKLLARVCARTLVGYSDHSPINKFLYTALLALSGRSRPPRLLECDMLSALGIPVAHTRPSFIYTPQPSLLRKLGLTEKEYVVLHLFSGGNARGLSPGRKNDLISALHTVLSPGMRLVVTGSPRERTSLGTLPSGVISAETSLQELAALIDSSALMVSLDTGAAHIAAHMRKPLVVLASCVGVQWWSKDMYGEGVPTTLFTRLDVCAHGHDYSGYAQCLDAINPMTIAVRAKELLA